MTMLLLEEPLDRVHKVRSICLVLIAIHCCCLLYISPNELVSAVVVDGRRKGPSALMNQSNSDELIDGYNTKDCGIADPDTGSPSFVNQAKEGQFPWLVSFQVKPDGVNIPEGSKPKHFCMGSFISDRWILSAAHCFAQPVIKKLLDGDLIRLAAGSADAFHKDNHQFTVKRIFYHSQFDRKNPIGFDVALIEVAEKAKFKTKYHNKLPFINSVCLPKQGKEFKKDQAVKIAGWGDTESKASNSKPDILLTTDMLITDQAECAKIFAKKMKKVKTQYAQFKDFICASYKGRRDACQGDSGGSLLEYADNKAVAVGIVSYGLGCATPGVPGVYERVSSLMPWIKDITQNKDKAQVYYIQLARGEDTVEKTKKDSDSKQEEDKKDGIEKEKKSDEKEDKKEDKEDGKKT